MRLSKLSQLRKTPMGWNITAIMSIGSRINWFLFSHSSTNPFSLIAGLSHHHRLALDSTMTWVAKINKKRRRHQRTLRRISPATKWQSGSNFMINIWSINWLSMRSLSESTTRHDEARSWRVGEMLMHFFSLFSLSLRQEIRGNICIREWQEERPNSPAGEWSQPTSGNVNFFQPFLPTSIQFPLLSLSPHSQTKLNDIVSCSERSMVQRFDERIEEMKDEMKFLTGKIE